MGERKSKPKKPFYLRFNDLLLSAVALQFLLAVPNHVNNGALAMAQRVTNSELTARLKVTSSKTSGQR